MDIKGQINHYIGKNVRARRIIQGITREELAYRSTLNEKYIGKVERGESNISVVTLFKLGSGLGLSSPLELLKEVEHEVYSHMKRNLE